MSWFQTPALGRQACAVGVLAAALAAPTGAATAQGPTADQPFDRVTIYQGPGLSGASKSWDLPADQLFLAIPFAGEAFSGPAASVQVGAELGVALFQGPFFTSADDTCEYQLSSDADPQRWWISDKVRLLPETVVEGPVEGALEGQQIGSLIVYRRLLGPPPGVQLLEQRRYVNWSCDRPTKARGYKRLFLPAAAPPNRTVCLDLETTLRFAAGQQVKLDFTAASLLLLMLPGDLTDAHDQVDHRFTAALFDDTGCQGGSVTFAVPDSAARQIDLAEVGFNRKARSVLLRYDEGALDEVLTVSAEVEVELEEPRVLAAPETAEPDAAPAAAVAATAAAVAVTEGVEVSQSESLGETVAEEVPIAEAEQQAAAAEAEASQALAREDAGLEAAVSSAAPAEPAPEPTATTGDGWAEEAEEAARDLSEEESAGAGSAVGGATAPSTAQTLPADTQVGFVASPETPVEPPAQEAPAPETAAVPAAGVTFNLPLLQGYRLHACLQGQQGCGEPAANAWCRARGFTKSSGFRIDENIGSLFPTLAIENLELCANFVCDGFKEITCTR